MPNIITISREFGSGGRELGMRLAVELGVPCYDHEIIDMVAARQGLDPGYVANISEKDVQAFCPSSIENRFALSQAAPQPSLQIVRAERDVIRRLALRGDCVIVGRCADTLLKDLTPLNLFVYADRAAKLERCIRRASAEEGLSAVEMLRRMKKIDRGRAAYRALFSEDRWGEKEVYHLCVNTTGKEIARIVPALAAYAKAWFGESATK